MKDYQVVWRGWVSYAGGWGTACREYVLALDKLGVDVKIDSNSYLLPETDPGKLSRLKTLIKRPYTHTKPKILIYHGHPGKFDIKKERRTFDYVVLNTAWETSKIPGSWFPAINQFDAVFVPSNHNIKALKNSGVKVPIFLVPHGADTKFFYPAGKKLQLPGAKGKFIFVSVFDFQHRKNPEGLLKAYWNEFKPTDNVMLVVKTYWSGDKRKEQLIREIVNKYKVRLGITHQTAPLVLITSTLPKNELAGLYALADAFVLPTRGEGVGLPFVEALSSGIPVIATGWGGQMDFLNRGNAFLVDYKLQNPAISMKTAISRKYEHLFNKKGQLWAEPDINSLQRQMRYACRNPGLCRIKGKQGRQDMLKMSWDNAGQALKNAIEDVLNRSLNENKKKT